MHVTFMFILNEGIAPGFIVVYIVDKMNLQTDQINNNFRWMKSCSEWAFVVLLNKGKGRFWININAIMSWENKTIP